MHGERTVGLPENGKQNKLTSRDPPLAETACAIPSLNEAWFHTLDRCVTASPLGEIILPLMRDCFFGGAMHAVLLMQKGQGEQLASDIARFIMEEPVTPRAEKARSSAVTYRELRKP